MAYVGFGTDLIVSSADQATAQKKIDAIVRDNAAKKKAYDKALAAYQKAVADSVAIVAMNAKLTQDFKNASLSYASQAGAVQGSNSSNAQSYNAGLADWQSRKNQYDYILKQRTDILAQQKAASDEVLKSVTPPSGYQGCLTAAQRSSYAEACNASKVVVRGTDGLGALGAITRTLFGLGGGTAPECIWQSLPVCANLPALPPDPGSPPTKPKEQPLPPKPVAPTLKKVPAVPPKPLLPVLRDVPHLVVRPDAPPLPPEAPAPRSFAVAGLLALVVVGGGAAYYFSTRKKKVA